MKKFLFLGIIVFSSSLMGSETRVNTMGGVAGFLIDNSNVRLYPALINDYPNEIIGELKHPSLSCFISAGKFGVFGLGINTDTVPTIVNRAIHKAGSWHFTTDYPASPEFAIYYGKRIMPTVSIGLKLGESNRYCEKNSWFQDISISGGMISVKLEPSPENSIELTGGVKRFSFESRTLYIDTVNYKDQGKLSFNGRVRILSRFSPEILFIAGGNYEKIDASWKKEKTNTSSEDLTSCSRECYTGFNFTPTYNTTVILGALIGEEKGDTTRPDTAFTNVSRAIPKIVVSMETEVTNWLTVRIGGNKSFNDLESKKTSGDTEIDRERIKEEKFKLAFGWSIKFKSFELDVMSNELPFTEPSIGLSATYKFSSF